MIKRNEILNILTKNITDNIPFVFQKYGDGEIACMMGEQGMNCDRHPYSKELAIELIASFGYMSLNFNDVYTAKWVDDVYKKYFQNIIDKYKVNPVFVEYDSLLHLKNQIDNHIYNFIKSIKESKNRKIFFGPARLQSVEKLLNINYFIEVPLINGFNKYAVFREWIEENIKRDDIVIFSSGMMSKVLIKDVRVTEKQTTCIDFGSSFDPIFVGRTRLKQEEQHKLLKFYDKLI